MTPDLPLRARLSMVVILLTLTAFAPAAELRNVKRGDPLPPFSAPGLDGKTIESKDTAGKVMVLLYMCAKQHQSAEALADAHQVVEAIQHSDLRLVYMSADVDQAEYFTALRDRAKAHEPFAFDEGRKYYGQLGMLVYPTTVVTSKQGTVVHVISSWTRDYRHTLDNYCRHALGEFDEAELAERLTAKPVGGDDARAKADRHRSVAAILRSKGMTGKAVAELEQALAVDPSCADAVVDLAEILVSENKLDAAESRIREILAREPKHHRAQVMFGLIQLKRGQLDEAEKLLKEALVLNPDPVRANYYLGQLYEQKGEYKLAMDHYRKALEHALKEP